MISAHCGQRLVRIAAHPICVRWRCTVCGQRFSQRTRHAFVVERSRLAFFAQIRALKAQGVGLADALERLLASPDKALAAYQTAFLAHRARKGGGA